MKKMYFKRFWLAMLLAPFVVFAVLDFVGYWLFEHGIEGYPPLTNILVHYVPMPVLIVETLLIAVAFCLHWLIAKRDLNRHQS